MTQINAVVLEFDWLCEKLKKILIEMTTDQPVLPSADDEIELREVFAALQRRWYWVFGGGLLGLALAAGAVNHKLSSAKQVQAGLILDVAQGPCYSRSRRLNVYGEPSVLGLSCFGEIEIFDQFKASLFFTF